MLLKDCSVFKCVEIDDNGLACCVLDGDEIDWQFSDEETNIGDDTIVIRAKNGTLIILKGCLSQVLEMLASKVEVVDVGRHNHLACA